jgi:hypothetical protein
MVNFEEGTRVATIAMTSPANGTRVSGTSVALRATISGGKTITIVGFEIGAAKGGTVQATRVSTGLYGYTWNTTKSLQTGSARTVDSCYWIRAVAIVDGVELRSPYVRVTTANKPQSNLPEGGWRSTNAWSANYSGTFDQWKKSHSNTIGTAYASLRVDPVKSSRKAIRASVPDSARWDAEQPTKTTVRFQSASKRSILEGDEICIGFAILPPTDFPTTYGEKDTTNPGGRETGWINVFQFYGPPYDRVATMIIQANRRTNEDPMDEFFLARNDLNEGEPVPLFSVPYNRGKWTDIVIRMRASRSIESGWVEFYVNQGRHTSVQPVAYINGLTRIPRVTLHADSEAFRHDMQIYRVADRIQNVTLWHTGHKMGRTVAEVDPKSYA